MEIKAVAGSIPASTLLWFLLNEVIIMYRAERIDEKGKIIGFFLRTNLNGRVRSYITDGIYHDGRILPDFIEIKPETLEVYILDRWCLLSDLRSVVRLERTCKWTQDEDGLYHTECGNTFYFDSGTLKENKQKFCGYCGKIIEEM